MKKLLTFLGIFSIMFVLSGCNGFGDDNQTSYEEPSFVDITIDGLSPVEGSNYKTFYKMKNESTIVEVVIDNPDQLTIKGIVINGYRHTRFTENSTPTNLFIEFDPGTVLGMTEYSVDDIVYFDGTDTGDVVVEETNNVFNVYVVKEIPVVERENYVLTQNSITIDFQTTDVDNVINEGTLIVELFSGDDLESWKVLEVGFDQVVFDNLDSNKTYDVKVKADFDLDDSNGLHEEEVRYSGTFTTFGTSLPNASVSNMDVQSDSITFDVTYNDEDSVTAVGGLRVELYENGSFLREITLTGSTEDVTFDGLYNSTEYTVRVITNYNLRDGNGLQTDYTLVETGVTTLSRSVPVPVIEDIYVEENRILFNVTVEDDEIDPIIFIDTLQAKVYIEGNLERTVEVNDSIVDIQIYDVLAGNQVYIELVADYDLNDGNGRQVAKVIHTIEYETLLNSAPIIYLDDVYVTQGYVNVGLNIVDINNTLSGAIEAILYEDEIEVKRVQINLDTEEFSFPYLVEYSKNYRMEIIADYNLRDGEGPRENQVLYIHTLSSLVPKAPAAEVLNIATTTTGFTFDVLVMDADNTIVNNTLFAHIIKNGVIVDTVSLSVGMNALSFDDLFSTNEIILSDNNYEILVISDYDVNDNNGVQLAKTLGSAVATTKPKQLPAAVIANEESTIDSITMDIFITDLDDVIEPGSLVAILTQNGVQIGLPQVLNVGDNFDITFSDIMSDVQYKVEIIVDYDLDNNEGIIAGHSLGDTQIITQPKNRPGAEIQNISSETETITFDVVVTDVHDVIIDGTTKAVLYVGETPTGQVATLNPGLNIGVTFNNVYSNQSFNIRIITDYDLNDGVTVVEDEILDYDYAETSANQMVNGSIYSVSEGIDTLTFAVAIIDEDNVVTDNLRALLFLDNVYTNRYIDVTVGDTSGLEFDNLLSDSEYTIQLVTDFNLRDIAGEQTGRLLDSYTTTTDDYSAPIGYVEGASVTIDSITFNTMTSDQDNTLTGDFKVGLYDLDGDLVVGTETVVNLGLTQDIEFTNLFSGYPYEVRLTATYDLFDGQGDQVDQVIYSAIIETDSRRAPVGQANGITITDDSVFFTFSYSDPDDTLIPNSLKAWLYDDEGSLVSSKNLYTDEVSFDISFLLADYPIEICITGDYDLENGFPTIDDGKILCVDLRTKANNTPDVIISGITINQDNVAATISVTDEDQVVIGNLKAQLFDSNHVLVDEVLLTNDAVNYIQFSTTLNHRELYNVMVVADYNLRDGNNLIPGAVLSETSIMAFNLLAPQSRITNIITTVNSITVDINVLDNDLTYVDNAIARLYKNGVYDNQEVTLTPNSNNLGVQFTGLVSDADYEVRVYIDYNNSDGNGDYVDQLLTTETIHVDAKEAPTASIDNVTTTSDQISANITITDTFGVITGNRVAKLYKDGVYDNQSVSLPLAVNPGITFTNLNSDSSYEIRVHVDYDLDDDVTVVAEATLATSTSRTDSNTVPTAQFTALTSTTGSITFSVDITDVDSVIAENTKAVLYQDGIPVVGQEKVLSVGSNTDTFSNLNSDSTYTIYIQTDYDLLDGTGEIDNHIMTSSTKATGINDAPTAVVGNETASYDTITFDVVVTDDDNVISGGTLLAVLYKNGLPDGSVAPIVLSVGSNAGEQFTGIFSNQLYEVRIVTDYDLNDGSGAEEDVLLDSFTETTLAKQTPSAVISNQVTNNTEITFDVQIDDPSSAIINLTTEAVLLKDGTPTGDTQSLSVGSQSVTFSNLEFGAEYSVEIQTDYNNNIGDPNVVDFVMATDTQSTDALVAFVNFINNPLEVNFDVLLDDEHDILYDTVIQIDLYSVISEVETKVGDSYVIDLAEPTNSQTIDILNYYNNHDYILKVNAKIDDGLGGYTDTIVYTQSFTTERKIVQAINLNPIAVTGTEINTGLVMDTTDADNQLIQSGTIVVKLYQWNTGTLVWDELDSVVINSDDQTISFSHDGTDGEIYKVTVEATVDFNEKDLGTVNDYVLDQRTFIWTTQN